MRILDRYIITQFLKTFIIISLSLAFVFIVVDVFDRLPRLLRTTSELHFLIQYFLLRIPYLFVITSPVTVLLAGLFLMDMLSKYNESIAIRASGVSINRLVTPLFVFGIIYSIFIMFFGDLILPKAEDHREYLFRVKIRGQEHEDVRMRSNIQYRGEGNTLYNIGFFDGFRNTLRMIDITTINPKTYEIERKLTAVTARWQNDQWIFDDCVIRTFQDGKLLSTKHYKSISLDDINVTPTDFVKSAKSPMSMNYFELSDYIARLKRVGENYNTELVDLYTKISFPFANFIIMLFCVPLATVSMRSRYRGMIFIIGIIICFLYLTVVRISQSLGYNEVLHPATAAWLPHAVFFLTGIMFVSKAEV
ncbi:MAG: LptF/LptG family permease [Candidatus Cloacimonetes bacterium]|nr:LptF/LptG family permease [Candidatus Cloacimonadota bacterium]